MKDSKDEKNLLAGLNLHYVDAMALNDDEKGLLIELFGFYLLDDLLGIRKCRVCLFRRNLFVDSENYFRRRFISSSEADGRFSFFLNARSQLLEVIFLLVQAEAQYNSVTINNISTVGVVKWGSSIFVL